MGCDIHTVTEIKSGDGWKAVLTEEPIFEERCYEWFAFLAGVRNYGGIPTLARPRGWPDDPSDYAVELMERWDDDGHNFSFVTLAELRAFDYSQSVENRRVTRQIAPNCWDGGCTAEPGEGVMTTFREYLGEGFFSELDRLAALGAPEVRVLFFFDN